MGNGKNFLLPQIHRIGGIGYCEITESELDFSVSDARSTPHRPGEGPAITATVTLREAGRRLKTTVDIAQGIAIGLGITLTPVGSALAMTERDFTRVERAFRNSHKRVAATTN